MTLCNAPIYHLNVIDSSNYYAMQMINANTAQDGTLILARHQLAGRGQRGKIWLDQQDDSLLMTLIWLPAKDFGLSAFQLSSAVALAVVSTLLDYFPQLSLKIKWPNDIYIGDKKTAGILIENSFNRGQLYSAVIGVGINLLQNSFPESLPNATSLYLESGIAHVEKTCLAIQFRHHFYRLIQCPNLSENYHQNLYGRGTTKTFVREHETFTAKILGVDNDGRLLLWRNRNVQHFHHGTIEWVL